MSRTKQTWTYYREIKGRPSLRRAALVGQTRKHFSIRGVFVYGA